MAGRATMPPNASGSVWFHGASLAGRRRAYGPPEVAVKLSIKAELAYRFADATQIIANIEASHTATNRSCRKR